MAVYDASSRYTLSSDGREANRVAATKPSYTLYTVKEGDTLERISLNKFGDTKRYWEIADINPQIKFSIDLSVGDVLRIPL